MASDHTYARLDVIKEELRDVGRYYAQVGMPVRLSGFHLV